MRARTPGFKVIGWRFADSEAVPQRELRVEIGAGVATFRCDPPRAGETPLVSGVADEMFAAEALRSWCASCLEVGIRSVTVEVGSADQGAYCLCLKIVVALTSYVQKRPTVNVVLGSKGASWRFLRQLLEETNARLRVKSSAVERTKQIADELLLSQLAANFGFDRVELQT